MSGLQPASNLPAAAPEVHLRAVTAEDWPLIRRWLGNPDVIRWWGPKATTEAEVMLAMASPQAVCRIIEAEAAQDGMQAVGYAHAIEAGLVGDVRTAGLEAGTWQIDLFVASVEHRGKGVGARALVLMRDELFATTLALSAASFVAVGNEKAVRAYEEAGFSWRAVARVQGREPEWIMVVERAGAPSGAGLLL